MGGQTDRAAQILARASRKPGGVRQTYREADGKMVITTHQDVEPHLKYAADMRRAERESIGRFGKTRTFHQKMSIPNNIMLQIAAKLGIAPGKIFDSEYQKRIGKELKSPEYAGFRTTERRI